MPIPTLLRRATRYGRKQPLILMNGLAEQAETWFRNLPAWRRHFDVHLPNILAFEGEALHQRIDSRQPVDIDYLVEEMRHFLARFVQRPPYFLAGSSTGGKVVVEYALRYPQEVARLVLLGPSGLSREERMPVVEGVRRNDARTLIDSVFHRRLRADRNLLRYYRDCMTRREWKKGVLKSIRGTFDHSIRAQLAKLSQPTLMLMGEHDRIVNFDEAREAALAAPMVRFVPVPDCGHAPHQEKPRFINRTVVRFLRDPRANPLTDSAHA